MTDRTMHSMLILFLAAVWLVNGLVCKVLHFVPRHEQIVAGILGEAYAAPLTILIGFSEIIMAIWIVSKFASRWNAMVQIVVVAVMNILECILVPELLLWGRLNALFAFMFIGMVYYTEFVLHRKLQLQKQ